MTNYPFTSDWWPYKIAYPKAFRFENSSNKKNAQASLAPHRIAYPKAFRFENSSNKKTLKQAWRFFLLNYLFVIATGFEPVTVCLEGRCSIQLSYATPMVLSIITKKKTGQCPVFVGVAGFEPATSCSQSRRDNRATLHPVAERQGFEPWQHIRADRLAICSITTLAPLLFPKIVHFSMRMQM